MAKLRDPDWGDICAKCMEGEIEPDCEYYGEPNGCNSPIYGEHPKSAPVGNATKLRKALDELMGWLEKFLDGYSPSYPFKPSLIGARSQAVLALSAPPRNCDRFESENDAWDEFMKTQYPQYAGRELLEEHARQIVRRYCSWLFEESRKGEK